MEGAARNPDERMRRTDACAHARGLCAEFFVSFVRDEAAAGA